MNHTINIVEDVTPLSVFRQQASEIIKTLTQKRRPKFITINGKVEAVVQDAHTYQETLDRIDELETMLSIQRGLDDVAGGRTKPADKVFSQIRARHE